MDQDQDYYQILGISRDALPEELRNAYFVYAKRFHPDANPDPVANDRFITIKQAYETLIDPEKRTAYDLTLEPERVAYAIQKDIKYSRSVLPVIDERQLVYVMLELVNTVDPDPSMLLPINLCLVIDVSTSMKGERMDMIKASASRLLRKLKTQDNISVVAFSDRAEVVVPATQLNDLPRIEQKISLLSPGGGTEIYQGLEAGVRQLQAFDRNSGSTVRHLILFTDGHTYGDDARCIDLVKQAKEDGLIISILGIGHEWNDKFLDRLAGFGGGNAIFVTSPQDIDSHLEQKIKMLSSLYARNITFDFRKDAGVELRYAFRLIPDTGPLSLTSPINLGNLYYGRNISVLFEFLVPGAKTESGVINLARGKLKGDLMFKKGAIDYPLSFQRPYAISPEPESPPPALVEAMARLTLYRLQERARKEVEEGQITKATKHLQHLATHLLSTGQRELAHTVLVEAEHIKQSNYFSKDGDKRIKYGTRKLLLPSGLEQNK